MSNAFFICALNTSTFWFAGEVDYGAEEVGAAADGLPITANGLPTITDGLPSSLGFGDGEQGGAGEEVDAGDEDLDVDEDAPCASLALPAHAYSTVKLQSAVANPSSIALSYAQPASFIEHDVACHVHAVCHWVEHEVGLSPLCVADEDPRRAAIVEHVDMV
jgi:hypothetical protein